MTSNKYYFLQHYSLHNCKEEHIIGPMHQGEGRKRPFAVSRFYTEVFMNFQNEVSSPTMSKA
jgi:hypothetical protein